MMMKGELMLDSLGEDSEQTSYDPSIQLQEEFQWVQTKAEKQTKTDTTKETNPIRDHFIEHDHQWQKES
jgi:hypothetical protein